LNTDVSQGSVATSLKCDENFRYVITAESAGEKILKVGHYLDMLFDLPDYYDHSILGLTNNIKFVARIVPYFLTHAVFCLSLQPSAWS